MRTNVVVDNALMAEAMRLTGIHTRREVMDTALRTLVRLERQRAVLALEGTVAWESDLEALRTARLVTEERTDYDADAGGYGPLLHADRDFRPFVPLGLMEA